MRRVIILSAFTALSACQAAQQPPPTQVVYRFDDHRFLELTGFNCEGGLTYTDTKRNIHSVIYENSDRYRVYTKTFIHPSERYIVIPVYGESESLTISKDYGQTWEGRVFHRAVAQTLTVSESPPEKQHMEWTLLQAKIPRLCMKT